MVLSRVLLYPLWFLCDDPEEGKLICPHPTVQYFYYALTINPKIKMACQMRGVIIPESESNVDVSNKGDALIVLLHHCPYKMLWWTGSAAAAVADLAQKIFTFNLISCWGLQLTSGTTPRLSRAADNLAAERDILLCAPPQWRKRRK